MLEPRDVWVDGTATNVPDWKNKWFANVMFDQINLFRQCRYTIRKCLAHTRNIRAAIDKLPVPNSLKEKLKLDVDYDLFIQSLEEGLRYSQ